MTDPSLRVYADKADQCVCQNWDAGTPWRTHGYHHMLCRLAITKQVAPSLLPYLVGLTPAEALDEFGS